MISSTGEREKEDKKFSNKNWTFQIRLLTYRCLLVFDIFIIFYFGSHTIRILKFTAENNFFLSLIKKPQYVCAELIGRKWFVQILMKKRSIFNNLHMRIRYDWGASFNCDKHISSRVIKVFLAVFFLKTIAAVKKAVWNQSHVKIPLNNNSD